MSIDQEALDRFFKEEPPDITAFKKLTPEELSSNEGRWIASEKPNCITTWLPHLIELGIQVPKTEIVILPEELTPWAYGEKMDRINEYVAMVEGACKKVGFPCFLRSGLTSAKHNWQNSCFVPDRASVGKHMWSIAEFSAMAGIMGLPVNVYAARELLPTKAAFTAFWGKLPITREFRFFVRDGVTEHWQPYWPPASIESPDADDWEERLAEISRLDEAEKSLLVANSEQIGRKIGGYWSIDWLWVPDRGWFCTDMALGAQSYKWDTKTGEEC